MLKVILRNRFLFKCFAEIVILLFQTLIVCLSPSYFSFEFALRPREVG